MIDELKKLISKKEIFEQIITLKTKKEVIDFLNEKGYKIQNDNEIESLKECLSNMYEKIINSISEINDKNLENVSGGKKNKTQTGATIGATAGIAAGGIISSAAMIATNAILKRKGKKTLGDLDEGLQWMISVGTLTAGAVLGGVVGGVCGTGTGYLLDKK